MTNVRSTKRALWSSVVSLMLCFAMLLGTTYAWFTDSVTSANNIIKSGNLDVEMYWAAGTEDPAEADWTDASTGAIFNYANWEPGYVEVRHIKIANEGSLALKYQVNIIANGEVSKLADVIDVYYVDPAVQIVDRTALTSDKKIGTLTEVLAAMGNTGNGTLEAYTADTITIALKMQETAGNEYQNLAIGSNFSIQLLATQYTSETDGFGSDYDADAWHPDMLVYSAEDLQDALNNAVAGGEPVVLMQNIVADAPIVISASAATTYSLREVPAIKLDLNGKELTANIIVEEGATAVITNGTIKSASPDYSAIESKGNLTLDNLSITSDRHAVRVEGGKTVINGGTYYAGGYANRTQYALNVSGEGTVVIVKGGTFIGPKGTASDSGAAVNAKEGSSVTINGGNFSGGKTNTLSGSSNALVVNGGIFDQDPSAYVASGSCAVEKATDTYVILPSASAECVSDGFFFDGVDTYYILSAEGLFAFAASVNKYSNYEYPYKDQTVVLMNDIDLENAEWTPIGDYRFSANRFCGTFDGQGYTISNFKITKKTDKNDSNKSSYGFFGNVEGTVKNLTVSGATVSSYAYTGALIGRLNSGLVENCHVINATVAPSYWQGGIMIGQINGGSVKNCTVTNSTISGKSALGGLAGPVTTEDSDILFDNCTVKDCAINQTGSFGGSYDNYFAGLFGYLEAKAFRIDVNNCKVINTTVRGEAATSISGDFDGNTIYVDGALVVATADALIAALNDGFSVILVESLEGVTIKLPSTLTNVTIKAVDGVVLKDSTISAADGNSYSYVGLTFDGITFDNSRILLTGWRNGEETIKDLTVTNCVFKNLCDTTNTAPVHINKDAAEAVKNFTFTNNVIDGATGGSKSGIYAQVTGKVVVTNNVINNVSFRPYVIQVTTDDGIEDEFIVTGNTFSGSSVGRAQGLGNNAEGTDAVTIVVSGNIFKGITDAQQICYWNFNPEKTTADLSKNYYDIDITTNTSRIYFNKAAASVEDLVEMGVFPFYTALNSDGTINTASLKEAP